MHLNLATVRAKFFQPQTLDLGNDFKIAVGNAANFEELLLDKLPTSNLRLGVTSPELEQLLLVLGHARPSIGESGHGSRFAIVQVDIQRQPEPKPVGSRRQPKHFPRAVLPKSKV